MNTLLIQIRKGSLILQLTFYWYILANNTFQKVTSYLNWLLKYNFGANVALQQYNFSNVENGSSSTFTSQLQSSTSVSNLNNSATLQNQFMLFWCSFHFNRPNTQTCVKYYLNMNKQCQNLFIKKKQVVLNFFLAK